MWKLPSGDRINDGKQRVRCPPGYFTSLEPCRGRAGSAQDQSCLPTPLPNTPTPYSATPSRLAPRSTYRTPIRARVGRCQVQPQGRVTTRLASDGRDVVESLMSAACSSPQGLNHTVARQRTRPRRRASAGVAGPRTGSLFLTLLEPPLGPLDVGPVGIEHAAPRAASCPWW